MADVTINIKGNASQLKDELNSVANSGNASDSTTQTQKQNESLVPSRDSMIEEIKSRMKEHGVVLARNSLNSINDIILEYESEVKKDIRERISKTYSEKVEKGSEFIDQKLEEARKDYLEGVKSVYGEKIYNEFVNNEDKHKKGKWIGNSSLQDILDGILRKYEHLIYNNEERESKIGGKEEELKVAIQELKKFFEDEAEENDPEKESYIGKLRERQKELIQVRDSAETQEDAMAASKDLAKVNEELRNVLNGGAPKQGSDEKTAIGLGILHGGLGAINALI